MYFVQGEDFGKFGCDWECDAEYFDFLDWDEVMYGYESWNVEDNFWLDQFT